MLWDALKLTKDSSEFKMRETFAQELMEHKWFINAVFGGKKCKFGLVPLDDFKLMQDKLKAFIKKHDRVHNEEGAEKLNLLMVSNRILAGTKLY